MENLRLKRTLEGQPVALRTLELAKKVNEIFGKLPDDQKIAAFLPSWNPAIKEFKETPVSEWAKFLDTITPRESWSLKQLFEKFSRRFKFETIGQIRNFCVQKGDYFGITRRSMDFGTIAFQKETQTSEK